MPPVRPSCDKGPVTIASLVGTDSGNAVRKKVLAAWVTPGEPGAAPCVPRGQGGEPNIRENGQMLRTVSEFCIFVLFFFFLITI